MSRLEREIQTHWTRNQQSIRGERFLKGPIPLTSIARASRLPGKALSVFLAIQHRADLSGQLWITLPRSLLDQLGISRDAKSMAIIRLCEADLIEARKVSGRSTKLAIKPRKDVSEAEVTNVWWENDDWVVSAAGLSAKKFHYQIDRSQLTDLVSVSEGEVSMWPIQMASKSWVNIESFIEAFQRTLELHGVTDIERLNLEVSFAIARDMVQNRKTPDIDSLPDPR